MRFDNLTQARLLKRYKRFLADCLLPSGKVVTAHLANPGSMKNLIVENGRVWLEPNQDAKRKLKYSLHFLELAAGTLVCVNTHLTNRLVLEALQEGKISPFTKYEKIETEVKYGAENSRIDFILHCPEEENIYLEVKSVTLVEESLPGVAQFPDSISARGAKHLRELGRLAQDRKRAVLLYLVNRNDCHSFQVASHIDSNYAHEFNLALQSGVELLIYQVSINIHGTSAEIIVDKALQPTPLGGK